MAAVVIAILLAIVHFDVAFLGRSFVVTDLMNPLDYRPLPQNYGPAMVPIERWTSRSLLTYANIRDAGGAWWQWEPDAEFLGRAMETREWPFWDPYVGGGTPAMANMTPAYFFPPFTLMVALGDTVELKNLYYFLQLWCAGFFSVLFLRIHGLRLSSAILGGVVVVMSGALNQHIGTITLQTAACFPIVLYATRRFLDFPTATRTTVLTVVYASTALACFPPILMWLFGITAVYAGVSIWFDAQADRSVAPWRLLGHWSLATALSVGWVAFFYLPALTFRSTLDYLLQFYNGAGAESLPAIRLLQLLSPTVAGGVHIYTTPALPVELANLPYVGVVAIALSLLATMRGLSTRGRALACTMAGCTLIVLMKLFGVPPVQWIARLPLFNQIHYAQYFGMALGLMLAFLAAIGHDALLRRAVGVGRVLSVAGLVLAVSQAMWLLARNEHILQSTADAIWVRDWLVLNGVTVAAAMAIVIGRLRVGLLPVATAALLISAAGEGWYNNAYPSPTAWDIFKHPVPYVQVLREQAGMTRVLPFGALSANLNSAFEIFSLDSLMTLNPSRPYPLYRRYTDSPQWVFMREAKRIPPEPVLDRAGIGLLVIRDAFPVLVKEAQSRGYTVRFNDGYAWIFARPTLPRFFFSSEYRVLETAAALEAVAVAPSRQVLLEEPPGFASTPNLSSDPEVRLEAYHRNSVTLAIDAPRPGLVYAAESYAEGWTATVDGAPAIIHPANYAFRAIDVPAGPSRIEFRYWPPGLTAGLIISSASVLLTVAVAAGMQTRRLPVRTR